MLGNEPIPAASLADRLRIGWATPWNHRSAIARSASEFAYELSRRGHSVTVLRTEVGERLALPPRPAPGGVFALAACTAYDLRTHFDVVVAQVGDTADVPDAITDRLRDADFFGVFHDASVGDRDGHGEDTPPPGGSFRQDAAQGSRRRPTIEWLARRMVGAVAHGEDYAWRLREACPGPVATIPLAFTALHPPAPPPWDYMLVAVIGVLGPDRRIDQLVTAIAASPILRYRCRIRIIGHATAAARARLVRQAEVAGIATPEFTGRVSDAELRWRLRGVDVICCLRNPVLENASASLSLAQGSGRPALVSNHGCYAEVPADTVLACDPEHEARDVLVHLETLLVDPSRGIEVGRRAREFARWRHTPSAYVDQLLPLLADVVARRRVRAS